MKLKSMQEIEDALKGRIDEPGLVIDLGVAVASLLHALANAGHGLPARGIIPEKVREICYEE